jgi:hypothetical protein
VDVFATALICQPVSSDNNLRQAAGRNRANHLEVNLQAAGANFETGDVGEHGKMQGVGLRNGSFPNLRCQRKAEPGGPKGKDVPQGPKARRSVHYYAEETRRERASDPRGLNPCSRRGAGPWPNNESLEKDRPTAQACFQRNEGRETLGCHP